MLPGSCASDDALIAMFDSARKAIRIACQDVGPITLPNVIGPVTVPGCSWPTEFLNALGRAIWERNLIVDIVLSNPRSVPGGLKVTEAQYGHGWTCEDVAAEIVKTIPAQFSGVNDAALWKLIGRNLRICYIKHLNGNCWHDRMAMGMHAKHFIIDDRCLYIGSQNVYVADLAEWGVLIDDAHQTRQMMKEYWIPMWQVSYTGTECNPQKVMQGLEVDRTGEDPYYAGESTRELMEHAQRAEHKVPMNSEFNLDQYHARS